MDSTKKTDNSYMKAKVALRLEALELLGEPRAVRVMDAYHGHGKLWDAVREKATGWEIRLFRSDKQLRGAGTLRIDNARLLEAIDLSKFDLIDLDAYGWPTAQLKTVSKKAPKVPVLSTRIARTLTPVPNVVLDDLGFTITKGMPRSLHEQIGDELWEAWLYRLGYRTSRLIRIDDGGMIKRYELLTP